MVRVWVVQDGESASFLCPSVDGDVTYTQWVTEAGFFYDEQAALDTAEYACAEGFRLFSFFVNE